MSNVNELRDALTAAANDDGKGLAVLKKALTDNGYKHSVVSTNIMLAMLEDLDDDAKLYYTAIAAAHLPYHPADAGKETL